VGEIGKHPRDSIEHLDVTAAGFVTKITHRWTYRPKLKVNMFKDGRLPKYIEVRNFKTGKSGERWSKELK